MKKSENFDFFTDKSQKKFFITFSASYYKNGSIMNIVGKFIKNLFSERAESPQYTSAGQRPAKCISKNRSPERAE